MHIQYCHTTVDYLHVVVSKDISNRSAAALIYFTKLRCLEANLIKALNP